MARSTTVHLDGRRIRLGPWRNHPDRAYLAPLPHSPPVTEAVLREAMAGLAADGYTEVVTAALPPSQQAPYRASGFTELERLHLLAHDIRACPSPPAHQLRRGTRLARQQVLDLDRAAFPPFWRMDGTALREALAATPTVRFRVARLPGLDAALHGYAITGRAGSVGYIQRLAVHPSAQGRGLATSLMRDAIRWLHRRGARRVVVNTQEENHAALALYRRLGFRLEPEGLAVLVASLRSAPRATP